VVKDGATVIPNGGATRLTTGLTLEAAASDTLGTVTQMRITETDLATLASAAMTRSYLSSITYSLQTSGDGAKRIDVVAIDGALNESNHLSQDIVLDTMLPTISSTSINGGAAVATSTTVSVAVGASDDRSGLAQYQLSEAADFSGGTTTAWTAWTPSPTYTVSAGDGTRTVYARVRDAAGNVSTEAALNHDSIIVDAQGPTFTSAVVLAGGATTTTGTTVSIAFTAADTGSSVAHYRLSEDPDFLDGTTTAWTAVPLPTTCTLSGGDGSKTIYVRLRDANGNVSTETVTNHDSIMLDQQGPTFTSAVVLGGGATATQSTSVAISIAATDAGSSVAQYRLSENAAFTGPTTTAWTAVPLPTTCTLSSGDGTKTIYVQLRDANGNESLPTGFDHDSITLDQAGPAFTSGTVLGGGATYTGSTTVAISISATDATTSVADYRLSEASDFTGPTTTAWTAVPLPTTCSLSTGSGSKTIYVQLRDTVGNTSTEATLNHDSITLDQQRPTFGSQVTINSGDVLTTNPVVSLSIDGSDAGSGIADYQLSEASDFTGGTTTAWTAWTGSPQTAAFTLSADGSRTVHVRLRDSVGNVSNEATLNHDSITLDAAGPTFSSAVSINSAAATTTSPTVSVAISATDAGSSIDEYELAETSGFTGPTATGWLAWTGSPVSFTLTSGDGSKTVYVRLKDANGHVSTETILNHDAISLDQDAPIFSSQVSINSGAAGTKNPAVSVAVAATDAGSSISQYELAETSGFTGPTSTGWLSWAGSPVSFTLSSGDESKTVYVRLKDANGHVSSEASLNHDDIVLDTAAPQIQSINFTDSTNTVAVVTFNENIYGDAVLGPLASNALKVVVKSGSGVVLLSSTSRTGAAEATVTMSWLPPPATGDTVAIQANTATSVYDSVGNPMAANAGLDGTAKRLTFGASTGGGSGSAAAGIVQAVVTAFRGGSFTFPSADASAAVATPQQGQARTTEAPRAQAAQPLVQFHRVITAEDLSAREAVAAAATAADAARPDRVETAPAPPARGAKSAAMTAPSDLAPVQALASLDVGPLDAARPTSPWLVPGLALGAGLFLAATFLARRLVTRRRPAK
jgi:hypothetical protein